MLLWCCTSVFAQTWCPPGATWWFGFSYGSAYGYKMYAYTGDTLVDAYTAQKITVEVHSHTINPPQDNVYMEAPYLTRMENGVLYRHQAPALSQPFQWDTLIWYSAVPGDHWQVLQPQDFTCNGQFVVTDTGHVQVAGMSLRYVQTDYPDEFGEVFYSPLFVERIGCVYGTFLEECGLPVFEPDTILRCYQDVDLAYTVPNAPACDLVSGISPEHGRERVVLYPNPGASGFIVEMPAGLADWLELTDATGRPVLADRLIGQRTSIPVGQIASGIYLWTVRDGRSRPVAHGRWVKE